MDDLERTKAMIAAEKMDNAGAIAAYRAAIREAQRTRDVIGFRTAVDDLCTRLESAVARADYIRSQREALLNLIVRPTRGRWEAPPGDEHMGGSHEVKLYATREEAVVATFEAARKVADDDAEWEHPTREIY